MWRKTKFKQCPNCHATFGSSGLASHMKVCESRPLEVIISELKKEIESKQRQLGYYESLHDFNEGKKKV